jgi:hypothetical protein
MVTVALAATSGDTAAVGIGRLAGLYGAVLRRQGSPRVGLASGAAALAIGNVSLVAFSRHGLPVLLIALVARVLANVALTSLFGIVPVHLTMLHRRDV